MPHSGVTVYDLLLSCPGDVLDLKPTIDECVKSFNSTIGELNNVHVELKHWSTHSFPQSGDKPQKLLNKQFVVDCDMCIALLGTRFGTPTDKYDSGTEEEIEEMLNQKKQVFMYFVERNVNLNDIDLEQLNKVRKFKEKYATKGLYSVVKNASELRTQFQNALTAYLLNIITPNSFDNHSKLSPNLVISSSALSNDTLEFTHSGFQNVSLVKDKQQEINRIISSIDILKIELSDNNETPKPQVFSDEQIEEMPTGEVLKAFDENKIPKEQMLKVLPNLVPKIIDVIISEQDKELILNYCNKYNVSISSDFWDLGNLKQKISSSIFNYSSQDTMEYLGTDSEKRKKELYDDLILKISEFNDIIDYFSQIDNLYYVSLYVSNDGTTFDEDIDVRLYISKGHIVKPEDIPQPKTMFIDDVVKDNYPKYIFRNYHDPEIDDYSNYPVSANIPKSFFSIYSSYNQVELLKKEYIDLVKYVFCYDIRDNGNEDILIFNIPYLKQNTKMFFPSFLFFRTIPESIRYEICSKHSPHKYSKEFKIIKN